MIGRLALGVLALILPKPLAARAFARGADRMLAAPRVLPTEAGLAPALDALGGEIVRFRSRDGLRLSARWLPAEAGSPTVAGSPGETEPPAADPHEAILLLHGYSGSVAPDALEYGPFLRRIAAVLALDFRGHGESEPGPTTFGLQEIEDVAGALAWLGERGVTRVAIFGVSMGGMTGIAATAILGDGRLAAADADPDAPRTAVSAPRPRIVAVVGDSVSPEATRVVANRIGGPLRGTVARRLFDAAARRLGADPRAVEPGRLLPLLDDLPVLLIHGTADRTVPIKAGRRLVSRGGPGVEAWEVAQADHSAGHAGSTAAYESRVAGFLASAFAAVRPVDGPQVRVADRTTGAGPDPGGATL